MSAREGMTNTPIAELIAQYEDECCDHANVDWLIAAARRYVETMADSQVRCLLHSLAEHVAEKRSASPAPVFDMEAAVEAFQSACFSHWISYGPGQVATGLTAALPFLGTSAACDDIQPDMEVLRRELKATLELMSKVSQWLSVTKAPGAESVMKEIDAALAAQAGKQGGGK